MRRRRRKRGDARAGGWVDALSSAFRSPTVKQKEAYARYLHTLSAAAVIGSMTLLFSESPVTSSAAVRAIAMLAAAAVLFGNGAILGRGE